MNHFFLWYSLYIIVYFGLFTLGILAIDGHFKRRKHMSDRPLRPIPQHEILLVAMKITLREAAFKRLLTEETLEHISKRADEIVKAFHSGKIVEVAADNSITIREPDPDTEDPELRNNPDYPMFNKSKKTLDI